jgi:hypothetical protein
MKKQIWAWVIGGMIFAMIVGVWIWQLPNVIRRFGGNDAGIGAIASMFRVDKSSLSPDLINAQNQLDSNMQQISQTMAAQEVQAAVIESLKNKISVKNAIQAATVPPADANAPLLPTATSKIPLKK